MNNEKIITLEQLQKLLDYLQHRPYNEVHELIHIIMNIAGDANE